MYVPNPGNVVQALDAANGDLIWEYRPEPAGDGTGAFGRGVPEEHRDLRRPDLRRQFTGDDLRARRQEREADLGDADRGHEPRLPLHRGPHRRQRQAGHRHHRLRPLQGRRLLHHRPRSGHRRRDLAHIDDRAPRRARRRHLGRPAAALPRRQRRLDRRQLRPGAQDRLLGHVPGQALGPLRPRHGRRRAVHELEPGARPRHGRAALVLPVPARRDPRHGRGLRDAPHRCRRPEEALQDGQARHPLATRPGDRRVPGRDRHRLPEPRGRGPRNGRGDLPPRAHPGDRHRDQHVPEHVRLQGLARHGPTTRTPAPSTSR